MAFYCVDIPQCVDHFIVDGHLSCFKFLATINKAIMIGIVQGVFSCGHA